MDIDYAYLGGEASEGAGRGAAKTVSFIAAVQTNQDGHPRFVVFTRVPGYTKEAVENWAGRALSPSTRALSDGLKCFGALAGLVTCHEPHVAARASRPASRCGWR